MKHHSIIWRMVTFALLAVIGAAMLACGTSGVPQADVDALKQQLTAQEQKAAALQQQLSTKDKEATDLKAQAAAKDKELADLKSKPTAAAAAPSGVTVLLGAQKVPIPTVAPPPTALPAGVPSPTPAPTRSAPASYLEPASLIVSVETLATTRVSTFGVAATVNCINSNIFKRGQRIVWRFEAYDPTTAKRLTNLDGATVKVRLPHGEELTARWSQRGGGGVPDAPWAWNTTWDIPLDYPLGGLDYAINVAFKDARTGSWKPQALRNPTTGLDTRLQIVE
jgi:hypothetical protein